MRRVEPLLVLLGYALASVLLIGRHLLRAPADAVVGSFGADQGFFTWSLVHWVEVLRLQQTPFLTDRIDAPVGFNLAWATTIPGPALLLAPVTALAGPLASYNVLALAAPALAAWTAYLLCRHLTVDPLAAILGGWAFGFSSYLLGQTLNHVNLALVWALPLIVLVVVRLIEGSVRRQRGVLALAMLIGLQYLTFSEVAATATLVGALALGLALALGGAELRSRIVRALPWIGAGYGLGVVIASPLILTALLHPNPISARIRPDLYPLDLANILLPTRMTWLGGERFATRSAEFAGNVTEQLGYVGPLLLVVAALGWIRWRRRPITTVIGLSALAAAVMALGGRLTIDGVPGGWMPWAEIERLPLIGLALPGRIVVYTWLGIALLVALFAARKGDGDRAWPARAAVAALALVLLLPTQDGRWWRTPLETPPGIASGSATRDIADDAVVLTLPYSFRGNGMHWQALDRMRWRQAGSYSAATLPAAYAGLPIMNALYGGPLPPDARGALLEYLALTGTEWVLIDARYPGPWTGLLREIGGERSDVGGVVRFRLDPARTRAQADGA
jgi:hypothetical protein